MTNSEIVSVILLFVYGIPYLLVIRLLWHIGSWFRDRTKKKDYFIVNKDQSPDRS
jgi:hypothetical protein